MKRREFLQKSMVAGAMGLLTPAPKIFAAPAEGYSGPLLVTLQMNGGWDVTSFCDPKTNQVGEPVINHWANTAEIASAGNIPFAPFASNETFFNQYYRDMLVINGVDAQTNSHTTGVLHNWSGRNSEGFPSLTAMFAAHYAPDQPLSYINSGGFAQTGDLIRFSRLDDVRALRQILTPERESDDAYLRSPADMNRIRQYRDLRIARMRQDPANLKRMNANLEAYEDALQNKSALTDFESFLPTDDNVVQDDAVNAEIRSNLRRQIQMTMATFQAGIGSASDLFLNGFDTHNDHDVLHGALFSHVAEALDYFWTQAEATGLADRITLVIGSDFGRTPNYNSDNGKDHWPISSFVVMKKDAPWGNRVAGATDEGHNPYAINPDTLMLDESNGTIIYPKHVHKALRRHLGLENTASDSDFGFTTTEDFNFFG